MPFASVCAESVSLERVSRRTSGPKWTAPSGTTGVCRHAFRERVRGISQPGARLSPYLWSKMDGSVWDDGRVSACLSRACARAMVPMFKVAWWRQVAASITKEKFSQQERAHFDLDDIESAEEIEDEAELAYLAGMSNHSFHTFNYAYAGSTNLTPTSLLHRAFIASHSWRSLLDIDAKLLAERPDPGSGVATQRLLNSIKSVQHRERPKVTAEDLGAVARKLYCGDLQFRPGQRRAMLAIMGRRQAEQVVVVMPTGAGKSLLFMVGACLEGAETTILILPTVALRANMLAKLDVMNIRYHVWQPGSKKAAPIVLVSTEAAITLAFKEYANRLLQQQRLDRIVIDECHLTLTARSYRRSMMQLAWHVRDVETQTVWR
ncbi:telomere-associated recQ-like helicase usher, partial [Mycosarcoma maydis]